MVFHAPQESHLPCQRPNTAPQFWQMKLGAWRAMGGWWQNEILRRRVPRLRTFRHLHMHAGRSVEDPRHHVPGTETLSALADDHQSHVIRYDRSPSPVYRSQTHTAANAPP